MPFNIRTFEKNIEKYSYLTTNKFDILVTPPPVLQGVQINSLGGNQGQSTIDVSKMLKYRIDTFMTPSVIYLPAEVVRYGYGPAQVYPVAPGFPKTTFTFIPDASSNLWQFFYLWLKQISDFSGTDAGITTGGPSYSLRYKDDYATTISVVIYDAEGNQVQTMHLHRAFPIGMSSIPLDWKKENEILKVSIALAYKDFTIEETSIGNRDRKSVV